MKKGLFGLTFSAFALLPSASYAQEEAAANADSSNQNGSESIEDQGEIIVTATRRESLASKTPVALTAITGEGLRESGVTNPAELGQQVPSLSIDRNNGGLQITIRGVTSANTTEVGDPSAAFMLDGVYIARPQAQEVSFYDINRVEVLRGPQGTLFGRNTTAGLVNVISNRPTFNLEGAIDLGYGNYDALQASGVLNLPVSDNLAVRASVNYDRRDNFISAGPRLTGSINPFKDNISGRLQALYQWSNGNLLVRGDYSDIGGTVTDSLPLYNFYAPTTDGVDPRYVGGSGGGFRVNNGRIEFDTFRDNQTWGIGAELNQDIGPLTLSYVGSYREFDRREVEGRVSADAGEAYQFFWDAKYKQNSQELRLATNTGGPLSLQAGAYYFKEKSDIGLRILFIPNPGPNGDGFTIGFFQGPVKAESYAFFGQGTYDLTESFRVTGGLRYSNDSKSRVGGTALCGTTACITPTFVGNNIANVKFDKLTWKVGLEYDAAPATLIYGNVSTGYKAGGFNDGCLVGNGPSCIFNEDALFYEPEQITAYELGVKTRLGDAVRLNASIFHYDFTNIQLLQTLPDCGTGAPCGVTSNGGAAKVDGLEIESTIKPSRNDKFNFTVTYLDAKYSNFVLDAATDFTGKPLDRSPKFTFSAGYERTFDLANGGNIKANVQAKVSDSYTLLILPTRNFYRQPSFVKTDASISYNAPDDRFYVQGFIQNITDENIVTTAEVGIISSVQLSAPRTYGVRAGLKF